MKWTIILLPLLLFQSCAPFSPSSIIPFRPNTLALEKIETYAVDKSGLKMPAPPVLISLDKDFKEIIPPASAKTDVEKEAYENAHTAYFAMSLEEFKKIEILLTQYKGQSRIIEKQAELINLRIDTINALKTLLDLKNQEIQMYRTLWQNSEQSYQKETNYHRLDNIINRALVVIMAGGIVLLAL